MGWLAGGKVANCGAYGVHDHEPGGGALTRERGPGQRTHRYRTTCSWTGSTGLGYDRYERAHDISVPPVDAPVLMSADPAFLGDAGRLNPEQLLLASLSSCQLLSFLAVAARARIDVVGYRDEAEAVMPEGDPPTRITEIHLRPTIIVRGAVEEARIRHLCEVAHRECFIASSLRSHVTVAPALVVLDESAFGEGSARATASTAPVDPARPGAKRH